MKPPYTYEGPPKPNHFKAPWVLLHSFVKTPPPDDLPKGTYIMATLGNDGHVPLWVIMEEEAIIIYKLKYPKAIAWMGAYEEFELIYDAVDGYTKALGSTSDILQNMAVRMQVL